MAFHDWCDVRNKGLTDDEIKSLDRQAETDEARFQQFESAAARAIQEDGAFRTPNYFPCNGYSIIHKSSRLGVAYQVTYLDDAGPSGHSEHATLDDAITRAWRDAFTVWTIE